MNRSCKDCDSTFTVDPVEQEHCRAQGLSLPRRCLSCRATRRELADQELSCSRCGDDFVFTAELAVLVSSFGWETPTKCLLGCGGDEEAQKKLRGERRKLAAISQRMTELVANPPSSARSDSPNPGTPKLEDLFAGLDQRVLQREEEEQNSHALQEASHEADQDEADDDEPAPENVGFGIKPRAGEDVPSPEDLFRGLDSPRRKG